MIGIERKRVARGFDREDGMQFRDMLGSIRTGRFSGEQLPKLLDQYEYVFLVVEGVLRTERETGHLKQLRGRQWETVCLGRTPFLADELYSFLSSISLHARVEVIQAPDAYETAEHVVRLEKYFGKQWDKHRAHRALHAPSGPYVSLGKAGTVRRVANALTGIGWERSATVEGRFRNVVEMANAEEGEWRKLDGFGKVRSRRVWEELRGVYDAGDGIE